MERLVNWIKKYGLKTTVLRGFYLANPVLPVPYDSLLRHEILYSYYKRKLKKYLKVYGEVFDTKTLKNNENNIDESKTIWWCWLQGLDNAPQIVKKCYQSVEFYAEKMNYNLVCLDSQNLFNYVSIPDFVVHKWKNGDIGPAAFTDICRLSLLIEYGGIWIDSTVLLTGEIDREILDADVFFFKSSYTGISIRKVSNWFISAKRKNNLFLLSLRDSLLYYWEENCRMEDYFIFHLFVALLSEEQELQGGYSEIPFYCNSYPKLMEREMFEKFDVKVFKHILKQSNIHKITYKCEEALTQDSLGKYILDHDVAALL